MQQTTVQLIFENYQKLEIDDFYEWMFNNEATLLREEKEHICDGWDNGFANGFDLAKYNDDCNPDDANRYYSKTFKTD